MEYCGGMIVGARPVLEQRTDKNFLKRLSNLYFSTKKLCVSIYFTYNHRYESSQTCASKLHFTIRFIKVIHFVYFDLENSANVIEFSGP